eukprot:scaffold16327_cov34-Prasinocladus_malaysianus.AAC.1
METKRGGLHTAELRTWTLTYIALDESEGRAPCATFPIWEICPFECEQKTHRKLAIIVPCTSKTLASMADSNTTAASIISIRNTEII